MKEYSISIDEFNKPKEYDGINALYITLIRLILLEPGTYQTNPNMGVGIISRYRYSTDVDLNALQTDIENQISEYVPNLTSINVELNPDYANNVLNLNIYLDNFLFSLVFNTSKLELSQL